MCIRVQYAPLNSLRPYDAAHRLITVPSPLEGTPLALPAVRGVLAELAIPQPPSGAVCFCGEPVQLLARTPKQQPNGGQVVISHGA